MGEMLVLLFSNIIYFIAYRLAQLLYYQIWVKIISLGENNIQRKTTLYVDNWIKYCY